MTSLSLAVVFPLVLAHAPQVAPETLAAFAQAESTLNPLAIYDNETERGYSPAIASEAVALAKKGIVKLAAGWVA